MAKLDLLSNKRAAQMSGSKDGQVCMRVRVTDVLRMQSQMRDSQHIC